MLCRDPRGGIGLSRGIDCALASPQVSAAIETIAVSRIQVSAFI